MKQKLLLTLGFITMIFIIQACRKYDFFGKTSNEFKVEDAKEWYYGVFKKSDAFKQIDHTSFLGMDKAFLEKSLLFKQNSTTSFRKYPYWNLAINYKRGSLQIVEMPIYSEAKVLVLPGMQHLSTSDKKRIAEASLQKIIFFRLPDNTIEVRLVTLIPDLSYLKSRDYDISHNTLKNPDKDLDGHIIIQKWDGDVVNIIQVKKSNYLRKIKIKKAGIQTYASRNYESSSASGTNQECGWVYVPIMVGLCVGNTFNPDAPPSEDNCDNWNEYETERLEYVPCEYEEGDPFMDCIQMGNDNDYCNCLVYGVGCPGGDDPPGDDQEYNELWEESIQDSTNLPCVDSILKNMSNLQNSLPKLIKDFFGKRPGFIPILRVGVRNHTYDNNGNTIPAPGGWTPVNLMSDTMNIYINSLYGDATDLSTAATIIHEMFHAHLLNEVRLYANNTNYINQLYDSYGYIFPSVFSTWLQNNSGVQTGTSHHQAIATMYRGLIADAINLLAIQRGINLPTGYADDLAWAGCFDSQAFTSLSNSNQTRIIDRVSAEKDPNNANGINPGSNSAKGNPCI